MICYNMKYKLSIYDYLKGNFKYKVCSIGLLKCWYLKIPVQFILNTSKILPDLLFEITRTNELS